MKLTRKQELFFIERGLKASIEELVGGSKTSAAAKSAWTPARRKKFSETMKKKFAGRKATKK